MQPTPKLSGWLFNTLQFTIKNLRRQQAPPGVKRGTRNRRLLHHLRRPRQTRPPTSTTSSTPPSPPSPTPTAPPSCSASTRTFPSTKSPPRCRSPEPAARSWRHPRHHALRKHLRLPPKNPRRRRFPHPRRHPRPLPRPRRPHHHHRHNLRRRHAPHRHRRNPQRSHHPHGTRKTPNRRHPRRRHLLILIPATFIAIHHHAETTPVASTPPASQPAAGGPNGPYVLPANRVLIDIPHPPQELHDQLSRSKSQPRNIRQGNLIVMPRARETLQPMAGPTSQRTAHDVLSESPHLYAYQDLDPALSAASKQWRIEGDLLYRTNARPRAIHQRSPIHSARQPSPLRRHRCPRRHPEGDRLPRPMEIHPRSRRTTVPRKVPTNPVVRPPHSSAEILDYVFNQHRKDISGQVAELIQQRCSRNTGFPTLHRGESRYSNSKREPRCPPPTPHRTNRPHLDRRNPHPPPILLTTPIADTRPLDDSLETFNRLYALAPGQLLKHIPPIDPDLRVTLLSKYVLHRAVQPGNIFDVLHWQDDKIRGTGNLAYPTYLKTSPPSCSACNFQIESSFRTTPLSGDFSYRAEKASPPTNSPPPSHKSSATISTSTPSLNFAMSRAKSSSSAVAGTTPSPDLLPAHFKSNGQPVPASTSTVTPPPPRSLRSTICSGADTIAAILAWWLHEDTAIEATNIPDRFRHPRTCPKIRRTPPSSPPKTEPPSSITSPNKPASPSPKKPAPSTTSSSNPLPRPLPRPPPPIRIANSQARPLLPCRGSEATQPPNPNFIIHNS